MISLFSAYAGDWSDANSLSGLRTFSLLIEGLRNDAASDGLSAEQLKVDIELKLRRSAIPLNDELVAAQGDLLKELVGIYEKTGHSSTADDPVVLKLNACLAKLRHSATIYLNVNTLKLAPSDSYIFNAEVRVQQNATLERDQKLLVMGATTWDRGRLGITPRSEMQLNVRAAVSDMVDDLLNAYLSKNPK